MINTRKPPPFTGWNPPVQLCPPRYRVLDRNMKTQRIESTTENEAASGRDRDGGKGGIRTLERALSILELLGSADSGMTLSAVAEAIDLPLSTTHRMLKALIAHGYVEQDLRTRWYELGVKVLELRGSAVTHAMKMAAEVRPHLEKLSIRSGLLCHLAIYRGGKVIYLDRVDHRSNGAAYVPLGVQAPAYSTGLGKVLLAHAPTEEVEILLASDDRKKLTPNTITDPDELRDELKLTRRRGFAIDEGESNEFRSCIGAPIFDYRGEAIAAISVAGTVEDIKRRDTELASIVLEAAAAISAQFGYRQADEASAFG